MSSGNPELSKRISAVASAFLVAMACAAVVASYPRVSPTWDEPTHVAAGLEWLQFGRYTLWTENPPLSRLPLAAGLYLAGVRLPEDVPPGVSATRLGNFVLYDGGNLEARLHLARFGVLPFFVLTAAVLWLWAGGRERDPLAGFLAVASFVSLPAVLAHGGLATTDVPFLGFLTLALFAGWRWLERPTAGRAAAAGLTAGLAVAAKLTALPFLAAAAVGFGIALVRQQGVREQHFGRHLRQAAAFSLPVALLTVWASYRFSVGRLADLPQVVGGWVVWGPAAKGWAGRLANALADTPLPAPEFVHGLLALVTHNLAGHESFALGQVSRDGFWYFYPLALLVKTPLTFLAQAAGALFVALRRRLHASVGGALLTAALILVLMAPGRVNIGLRHVLVIYVLLALAIGPAAAALLRERRAAGIAVALLFVLQVGIAGWASPQWIAYFNPLAGSDPAGVLNLSDLDWGQDAYALRDFATERGIEEMAVAYSGSARLCDLGLVQARNLDPQRRPQGWVAFSERFYRSILASWEAGEDASIPISRHPCEPFPRRRQVLDRDAYGWLLTERPVIVLGRSLRIYAPPQPTR